MIDEKKLIESFRASLITGKECFPIDLIVECIEEQPKVGEWISVSERLPDKHIVLCDVFYPAEEEDGEDFHEIKILTYVGDGEFRNSWNDLQNVVAWMPLPEPYRPKKPKQAGSPAADHVDQDTLPEPAKEHLMQRFTKVM